MKKLATIFLIFLLAFSQYARQLRYLECVFANNISPSAIKCDCETLVGFDKQEIDRSIPKNHTHHHPDDYFSFSLPVSLLSIQLSVNEQFTFPNEDECEGVFSLPQQPPDC